MVCSGRSFLSCTVRIFLLSPISLSVQCYAYDGQFYIFYRAGHFDRLVSKVTVCIHEIYKWMPSNKLKLNTDKTQFILLGMRQQLWNSGIDSSNDVKFQTSVSNPGVMLDSHLPLKAHVRRTFRTCYYQLR